MIKNRTIQLIFQTIYCTLAILGFAGSLGYFTAQFNNEFYIFYTSLSNYLCYGFMFVSIVFTIKASNKKEDGFITFAPKLKFVFNIAILVTCLVYNLILAKYQHNAFTYFTNPSNVLNHLILPIMFVLDWVLFYEHGKTKWYYPLLCIIAPAIYVVYIYVRALIVGGAYTGTIYPYFFLDPNIVGWGGVVTWISILLAMFINLGYTVYLLDNIKNIKNKMQAKRNRK